MFLTDYSIEKRCWKRIKFISDIVNLSNGHASKCAEYHEHCQKNNFGRVPKLLAAMLGTLVACNFHAIYTAKNRIRPKEDQTKTNKHDASSRKPAKCQR